jgi:ERCC4-type nuclease
MPRLRYTGTAGEWRTLASDDYEYKYVTVRGDNPVVDVDEKTAEKLRNLGVFKPVDGQNDNVDTSAGSDETGDSGDVDDFDAIDGVGAAMEESLYDAGYTTYADIQNASDDELMEIDSVGGAAIDSLRSGIEQRTDNPETGDSAFDVGG